MCDQALTNMGFARDSVPVGTHMCLIYTSEKERRETLLKFLLSGLQNGERAACFSEKISEEEVVAFLKENGISYRENHDKGFISLHGTSEVYFAEGRFDPERMLNNLMVFYDDSLAMGCPASRVIGEMIPEVENVPGGERLLEYECRVSMLLRTHPVTSVCQYDAGKFDGATIMEVLKVHPKMIVNGAVVNNPFFVAPEEYLQSLGV